MLYTEYLTIKNAVIHKVGNKLNQDNIIFSKSLLEFKGDIESILINYFINPFKSEEFFNLTHESDLNLNEVFVYASNIFENPDTLYNQSVNLAKHLYENSTHPKIKSGEFYVVYFKDCIIEGNTVDALGLFKSENKETFLKVFPSGDGFDIESDKGVSINKLDKGCLIFNTEKERGYLVSVIDNTNKGVDAKYWTEDFLHIKPRRDEFFNTQSVLTLCKNFVIEALPNQFNTTKVDQADLLNKSVKFFKENEAFNMTKFSKEVMVNPEVIESFKQYTSNYQKNNEVEIKDSFNISDSALKKQARIFKSVIKLDKNFDIYIHGNRDLIEQGVDEKGRKYYKIYYKDEI
jgi:hypothetical protein